MKLYRSASHNKDKRETKVANMEHLDKLDQKLDKIQDKLEV